MGRYQIVNAEWALPRDVTAVEHVKNDGTLCLVYSTTIPIPLDGLVAMCEQHDSTCGAS